MKCTNNNAKLKQELNDYLKDLTERNLIRVTTSREIEKAASISSSSSFSSSSLSSHDSPLITEQKEQKESFDISPSFITETLIPSPHLSTSSPSREQQAEEEEVRKQVSEIDKRLEELSLSTNLSTTSSSNNNPDHDRLKDIDRELKMLRRNNERFELKSASPTSNSNKDRLNNLLKSLRTSMTRKDQRKRMKKSKRKLTSLSVSEVKNHLGQFAKRHKVPLNVSTRLIDFIQSGKQLLCLRESKLIELEWSDHRWRRDLMCKIAQWKKNGVEDDKEENDPDDVPPDPPDK